MNVRHVLWVSVLLLLFGLLGGYYWPQRSHDDVVEPQPVPGVEWNQKSMGAPVSAPETYQTWAREAAPIGAIRGERVLYFADAESYAAYLRALQRAGLSPLRSIDQLLSVRVSMDVLKALDPGEYNAQTDYNYRVTQPLPPVVIDPELLSKLQPYADSAYHIAGGYFEGDGAGVLVAVLDSGYVMHPALEGSVQIEDDLTGEGMSTKGAGHGTSVASIVGGRDGLVPSVDLMLLRVLDAEGQGNSFDVASGIIEAADAGASIINLSLGVYEDSTILRAAVDYALAQSIIVVAAAGNDARSGLPYPAAYPGVLAVTAIDANHRQAVFPNQSDQIAMAAPGVGIVALGEDAENVYFSGTSAAAPFVSGALAGLLGESSSRTPAQAVAILKSVLNDSGAPGTDPVYGGGWIDWGRLRERDISGILDVSVASIYIDPSLRPGARASVLVTVQNRGTEWLPGGTLEVRLDDQPSQSFTISSLQVGETSTREVYTMLPTSAHKVPLVVDAEVVSSGAQLDTRPENNRLRLGVQPR